MNEDEIKKILEDPKKLLDLVSFVHQLIHVYEAQKIKNKLPGSQEKMGLADSVSIQLNSKEVK